MKDIVVTVNGQRRPLGDVQPQATALDWLRDTGLSGSKEGCAEGECGACAVLLATASEDGGTAWTAVNSCLIPVAALNGQELVTVEGLGTPEEPHPVQEGMVERGGSQCGYCTPGFVCSMAGEYYRADRAPREPGDADHEHGPNGFDLHALSGNLCRCTGYRPIRDAAYALAGPAADDPLATRRSLPPPAAVATDLQAGGARFIRPEGLDATVRLVADEPGAVLVAGSTDWGVEVNLRGARAALAVAIDQLPELRTLTVGEDTVEIGSALTLSEIETRLAGRVPLLAELFPQFASRLIRNRATIGGNLGTGSPIGDTPPALLALGASVVLTSVDGEREVPLDEYFTGYRQSVRQANELIRAIRIPLPLAGVTAFHKIAKRRFDDISSVAIAFALELHDGVVRDARIGLGGVAATPIRARATEDALVGKPWSLETVRTASAVLAAEGTPISDHRASAAYRSVMLQQALLKLFATAGKVPA